MDFVFDRTAIGRVIKCLTVVEDETMKSLPLKWSASCLDKESSGCRKDWPCSGDCCRSFEPITAKNSVEKRWGHGLMKV